MATAQPWWLVSSSSLNGKPWNIITFEGSSAAAKGEGINVGGYPKGPFATLADLETWAANNKVEYINDPAASSGNPLTQTGNAISSGADALANDTGINAVGDFVKLLGNQSTWFRVLKVVGGLGLIVTGLVMIGSSSKTIQGAVQTAAKAAV